MKEFKVLKDHGSTMQSRAHFVRMFVGCEPGAQVHSYAHHLVILALFRPCPLPKASTIIVAVLTTQPSQWYVWLLVGTRK